MHLPVLYSIVISLDLAIHSLTIHACTLDDEGNYSFTLANSNTEASLKIDGKFLLCSYHKFS